MKAVKAMKAMVLDRIAPIESSPLKLKTLSAPQPGPSQVRVKVSCCGVCRTDLHVIEGDLPTQKLPIIPGHQIVGRVDLLGENCTRFSPGQRIGIPWLGHTCGECSYCRAGRENLCQSQRFTGYHGDGGYAEYAVIDENFAYEIPEQFTDTDAAPLLCAGIVGYRALKRSRLAPGQRLAIYGFGSSASINMQIALNRGCEVYVVTRGESHRKLADQMGATWVGCLAEDMPVDVDSAIIYAPAGELVPPALSKLKKGGVLCVAGIYMTDIPQMQYDRTLFYEKDLRSVTANTRQDGREFLAEAAKIPIRPRVTTYRLADANLALADNKADRLDGTAVLVIDG